MPRKNRPARNRRTQTPKVVRLDTMIARALATLPIVQNGGGK